MNGASGHAALTHRAVTATSLIVMSTLCFSLMHACVRQLGTVEQLHPFVIAFFRCVLGGGGLLIWVLYRGTPIPRGRIAGLIVLRSGINTGAMLCFFAALSMTQLTTVAALNFTSPLFATLGACLFLGERLRARRLTAIGIGFLGVILVLRPSLDGGVLGPVLVIASSVMWAGAMLMIKRLTDTVDSVSITAWSGILMAAMTLPPALFVWQWPTLTQWGWLALTAVVATGAQLALAEAFRRVEASAVMPFDFLKLIWASLIGYLWFAEIPSLWAWIGGAVIFTSTVYIAHRERLATRHG